MIGPLVGVRETIIYLVSLQTFFFQKSGSSSAAEKFGSCTTTPYSTKIKHKWESCILRLWDLQVHSSILILRDFFSFFSISILINTIFWFYEFFFSHPSGQMVAAPPDKNLRENTPATEDEDDCSGTR